MEISHQRKSQHRLVAHENKRDRQCIRVPQGVEKCNNEKSGKNKFGGKKKYNKLLIQLSYISHLGSRPVLVLMEMEKMMERKKRLAPLLINFTTE